LRALRRLKRESIESPFVFVSERGSPFTTAGYRKMIARLGEAARFSFPVHPHEAGEVRTAPTRTRT
jgi:type 1 fimbriae regulatory protein FimB/type 1 fimbriae regulatory protein FimE